MYPETVIRYIEQDDEYMYFEVLTRERAAVEEDDADVFLGSVGMFDYISQGTIYIGKVKGIDR